MRLQASLGERLQSDEGIDFNAYRAFKNDVRETTEPYRFVDGELIETFLDIGDDEQAAICHRLGPSVEDVRSLVEKLKGLH